MKSVMGIGAALGLIMAFSTLERPALARPRYTKTFVAMYEKELAKAIAEASKCDVCHIGGDKKTQNNYAEAVGKLLAKKNVSDVKVIEQALRDAEALPSAIEGKTFGDLIKEGRLPASK